MERKMPTEAEKKSIYIFNRPLPDISQSKITSEVKEI